MIEPSDIQKETDKAVFEIPNRLKALRTTMEISTDEMAIVCDMTSADYIALESGAKDISVSILNKIAHYCHVDLATIMFGEGSRTTSYCISRAEDRKNVMRSKAYSYEALANDFKERKFTPFEVIVEPQAEDAPYPLNKHEGQEFNLVLEGTLEMRIGDKIITLHVGDSIFYNSELPHGMKAAGQVRAKFLSVII